MRVNINDLLQSSEMTQQVKSPASKPDNHSPPNERNEPIPQVALWSPHMCNSMHIPPPNIHIYTYLFTHMQN